MGEGCTVLGLGLGLQASARGTVVSKCLMCEMRSRASELKGEPAMSPSQDHPCPRRGGQCLCRLSASRCSGRSRGQGGGRDWRRSSSSPLFLLGAHFLSFFPVHLPPLERCDSARARGGALPVIMSIIRSSRNPLTSSTPTAPTLTSRPEQNDTAARPPGTQDEETSVSG